MANERIQGLLNRYFKGSATEDETEELSGWVSSATEEELSACLREAWAMQTPDAPMPDEMAARIMANVWKEKQPSAKVIRLWIVRWAAAAAVVAGLAWAGYAVFVNVRTVENAKATKPIARNDALPGGNKATLTLSNGSTIILDSARIGELADEKGASVSKTDSGKLSYTLTNEKPNTAAFNTLSTPRGGQFHLILSDGTQVWLNSASSITYPTAFAGSERNVEVTGETYFEVAKDKSKPFNVNVNGVTVQVLGTHFNINGYSDEPGINTTLLEGSVRVTRGKDNLLLIPGQTAVAMEGKTLYANKDVDVEEVVAWKNGRFQFNHTPLPDVLRQLSRWYDVDVEIKGDVRSKKVWGKMQRELNLSEALDILKDIGVNFRIEGKKLIVMP